MEEDRRTVGEGSEEDWRRFGGGWVDIFSIDVRYIFDDLGSVAGALGEDWRDGGGSEEGWRRIGGGLEKVWRRMGR